MTLKNALNHLEKWTKKLEKLWCQSKLVPWKFWQNYCFTECANWPTWEWPGNGWKMASANAWKMARKMLENGKETVWKNGQCKCLKMARKMPENGQENAWKMASANAWKWPGKCLKMARKAFMELWWYHRCLNRTRPCNVNSTWALGFLVACLSLFWRGLFAFV